MSKITAADVNKLRKSTGAGIMDCKKALVEANGDFELAIENLRKKGQKVAAKRADRESSEGAVIAKVNSDSSSGVIISLNCETDFEQTGIIGEKLEIGSFEKINSNFVGSYIHAGNKIATIVGLSNNFDGSFEVAKNVCMQAAAMNPVALNEDGVSKEIIEKEIEIAKEQLRAEGKPEAMLENIAKGKLKKFFKDNTLVNQAFIKDNKTSVNEYIKSVNSDCSITDFKRVSLV